MRVLIFFLPCLLAIAFVSCSSGPSKTNPMDSVKGFIKAMAKNDMKEASEFFIKKRQLLVKSLGMDSYGNTRGPDKLDLPQTVEPPLSQFIFDRTILKRR